MAVGFASRPSVQTLLTTLNLSLVTSTSIFGYSVLQKLIIIINLETVAVYINIQFTAKILIFFF